MKGKDLPESVVSSEKYPADTMPNVEPKSLPSAYGKDMLAIEAECKHATHTQFGELTPGS